MGVGDKHELVLSIRTGPYSLRQCTGISKSSRQVLMWNTALFLGSGRVRMLMYEPMWLLEAVEDLCRFPRELASLALTYEGTLADAGDDSPEEASSPR